MIKANINELENFSDELLVIHAKLSHQNKISYDTVVGACKKIMEIRTIVRSIIHDEIKKQKGVENE